MIEYRNDHKKRGGKFPPLFKYETVSPYKAETVKAEMLSDEAKSFNRRLERIDRKIRFYSEMEAKAKTSDEANYFHLKISEALESILPPEHPDYHQQAMMKNEITRQLQVYE